MTLSVDKAVELTQQEKDEIEQHADDWGEETHNRWMQRRYGSRHYRITHSGSPPFPWTLNLGTIV
jgi:hypothetical protein